MTPILLFIELSFSGYYYRQGDYQLALAGWAGAAGVLRNFR